ncbi:MAG TPA: hypothetical protein VKA34_01085 [Balneolales bacterium]|nr:hypothetical protein [Balneolales bacterium]
MQQYAHTFHIPVMGTGHSVDTPIRVAPFGISSVISIVDDLLLEKIRKYYCEKFELPYSNIPRTAEDGRARRITEYLNTVQEIVTLKMEEFRNEPFFQDNEKSKYFDLLPDFHTLKQAYQKLLSMNESPERDNLENELANKMQPGPIDVNIMAKVDRVTYDKNDQPLSSEYTDANAALRGFAHSKLESSVIFSAGFNPNLYNYITQFRDFYRDKSGEIKKRIVLKVSDFRSALIQGKYLAKKGLEISEFRIESGLNCGGHAFPSDGYLLPTILQEFKEKKDQLKKQFTPLVERFYEEMGWEYPEAAINDVPLITVQGGIGNHGEAQRLHEDFNMDRTGWGSPFLLVPEATCIDDTTRKQLSDAKEKDLYVSGASPLGVPFNNLRRSGSEVFTRLKAKKGKPGSKCPKGFLQSNTEFTEKPICTASMEYQLLKIDQIQNREDVKESNKPKMINKVLAKTCLCQHLGNGALIALGISKESRSPQAICPSPSIAWFDRNYSLKEMVDHIYGRGKSLVPSKRPHMFAKEMVMYVDYFKNLVSECTRDDKEIKHLKRFKKNLEKSMDFCAEIANRKAFKEENMQSITDTVILQSERLQNIWEKFERQFATAEAF